MSSISFASEDDWFEEGLADLSQPWIFPDLGPDGWHPSSGDDTERQAALKLFKWNHHQDDHEILQMKKLYLEDNLFLGFNSPNSWILTSMKSVTGGGIGSAMVRGLVTLTKPGFTFFPGYYEEAVKILLLLQCASVMHIFFLVLDFQRRLKFAIDAEIRWRDLFALPSGWCAAI